jgi:acyl dehydratase
LAEQYLEDFERGQVIVGPTRIRVGVDEMKRFAAAYDPQPFHLDEKAAESSIFAGLAASGWHTAAMSMRLIVDSGIDIPGGLIGLGLEELRWPRPVRAGDELRVEMEVLNVRESKSRANQGLVTVKNTTLNQRDEVVQVSVSTLLVPKRSWPSG